MARQYLSLPILYMKRYLITTLRLLNLNIITLIMIHLTNLLKLSANPNITPTPYWLEEIIPSLSRSILILQRKRVRNS